MEFDEILEIIKNIKDDKDAYLVARKYKDIFDIVLDNDLTTLELNEKYKSKFEKEIEDLTEDWNSPHCEDHFYSFQDYLGWSEGVQKLLTYCKINWR